MSHSFASRLEAIALRLEAIASRLEAIVVGWRPLLLSWGQSLVTASRPTPHAKVFEVGGAHHAILAAAGRPRLRVPRQCREM